MKMNRGSVPVVRRPRNVDVGDRVMAGDVDVAGASIIVGDVVVSFDDADVLVVLSLVSHDSRGWF